MSTSPEVEIIQQSLLGWYEANHRDLPWRRTEDPYAIWVSEVMLQQTQVQTVIPYYRRFLERFPSLQSLANAELGDVLKIWEGLGYYARARNFHLAARKVMAEHRGSIPHDAKSFRQLPGVGEYIAAAVGSIAFDRPEAVVDGNVKRVLARLLQIDAPVNASASHKTFRQAADELLDHQNPGDFNQAMMELGAVICTPRNPDCACCPINVQCQSYQRQTENAYPKRIPSKPTPEVHSAVGVVIRNDRILITRRKSEGLLGGLWEFPGGKINATESAQAACVREIKEETNLDVEICSHLTQVRHAYTHFRVIMEVFVCTCIAGDVKLNGPVDYRWITLAEIERYPFPRANHKFIPLLRDLLP
ncbi:MAG: A/G-specific adenine glycosylase [Dehalococcoidia bacterium]|nr:A/G-specific adenine glycosylase [Dehalococcoidia bacterium]